MLCMLYTVYISMYTCIPYTTCISGFWGLITEAMKQFLFHKYLGPGQGGGYKRLVTLSGVQCTVTFVKAFLRNLTRFLPIYTSAASDFRIKTSVGQLPPPQLPQPSHMRPKKALMVTHQPHSSALHDFLFLPQIVETTVLVMMKKPTEVCGMGATTTYRKMTSWLP